MTRAMKHETALEILPWMLNGTLDSGERDELLAHLKECADCRRELEETRQVMEVFDQHLPTHDLVARAEGRETELPAETVDAHLESCPECAEELTLLVGSLHTFAEPPGAVPSTPRRSSRPSVPAYRRYGALAAALVGLLALAAWILVWQSLEAPAPGVVASMPSEGLEVNARILDLTPGDAVVRGLEELPTDRARVDGRPMVLLLNSDFRAEDAPFSMEIVDAQGEVLEREAGIPWPELGVFNVVIPAEAPGDLTIRIETAQGAEETYRLEATTPS